jgi:hypothetical protein
MAHPETTQTSPEAHDEDIGLLANGSSGSWEVSVDETISGTKRWFAQIEGPSVYVSFEVPSPHIIGDAVRFLAPPHDDGREFISSARGRGGLCMSKSQGIPVSLVRDDEYADRCFLIVGPGDKPVVRYSFAGEDMENLLEALRQANQDIID